MKRDELDRYMGQAGEPSAGQVESSVEAVWERLRPEVEHAPLPSRQTVTRRPYFTLAAAVAIVTLVIGLYFRQPAQIPPSPAIHPQAKALNPEPEAVVVESNEPAAVPPLPALPVEGKYSPASTAPLAFEVASIRLVPPPIPREGGAWTVANGRFRADLGSVRGVIAVAYGVKALQVKGGPDWIDRERYAFDARAASAEEGTNRIQVMLRTLLTERFKLAIHFDAEEATAYTLTVAKNGMKLKNANGRRNFISWADLEQGRRVTFSENTTLAGLTNVLGNLVGAPVFDETGLNETYDFGLEFTDPRDPRPRQANSPPDLFTALQQQLGLELRATRRRVEFVVIDRIERLSEN